MTTQLRTVPVWIRALAAVFVALACYAAVLVVQDLTRRPADGFALLIMVPQIILGVCVAGLFGFVAVTGLPPTHLFPNAGDAWFGGAPRFRVNPDMQRYLGTLRARHPEIREFWILGQPVRERGSRTPGWRFLAFGEAGVIEALRADWDIRRRDVSLFVVDERSQSITTAWGQPYVGTLAGWSWQWESDEVARFDLPAVADEDQSLTRTPANRGESSGVVA